MSSGATHFRVSITVDIVGVPLALLSQTEFGLGVTVGLLVGTFSTPDVRDIQRATYPVYALSRIPFVGSLLAYVLRVFWFPLALALPHRSKFSHRWVLGTVVAVAYCFAIVAIFGILTTAFNVSDLWPLLQSPTFVGIFTGWLLQDTSHILFDL